MREFFRGWRRRIGCVTLVMALVFMGVWVRSEVTLDSHVRNPSQFLPIEHQTEIIQASHGVPAEATTVPKVSVHVWMIEVVTSSPDSCEILDSFGERLHSALVEFNTPSGPSSRNFATSDILAKLISDFRSKAKIIVHDELPRIISSGQTEKWGNAISIAATPTIKSGKEILVWWAAVFGGPHPMPSEDQSPIGLQSGQTWDVACLSNSGNETKEFQVPLLGQSPIIGRWFTLRVTRTTGNSKHYLISATVLP